jgi:hypothetical protein
MRNHELLKLRLESAKGIGFDTCHKIYVLMDDNQMALMKQYGYDPLISSDEMTPKQMYSTIRKWFNDSCALRFISCCSTTEDDSGFERIVDQGERFYA